MAFPATSPMVVDLSGDNDNAGALAAAATIPTTNSDSAFERSCDNPECSAPKLISLVPKRDTPEFITEPDIMNQPTLINGFTTVFQIDGIAAKMNDIMYGDQGNSPQSKPKSVFRIVPNTHAHIVNYVVVDGAGETMRKIKANDADTMRKLLDSQRLSAEQMLKKLIGKAFKPCPSEPQVPPPISNKIPVVIPSPARKPTSKEPVPDQGPLQTNVLPSVPPGITITPIPLPDVVQVGKPGSSVSTSTPISISHPTTQTSMETSSSTSTSLSSPATSSKASSVDQSPSDFMLSPVTQNSVEKATSIPVSSPANVVKPTSTTISYPPTTTPQILLIKPNPSFVTSPGQAASTKPTASRSIPSHTIPISSKSTVPIPTTTNKIPAQPIILKRKRDLTPVSEAIKRLRPRSPKNKTPLAIGLKPMSTRSPPPPIKLPTMPKLPTKSPPTDAAAQHQTQQTKKVHDMEPVTKGTAKSTLKESEPMDQDESSQTTTTDESNASTETFPVKKKPLMGPASKMNAIKAMAAAKALAVQTNSKPETLSKQSTPVSTKTSITRIGETVITSTALAAQKAKTPQTKPCSVSIEKTDVPAPYIAEAKEHPNKEKTTTTSKSEAAKSNAPINISTSESTSKTTATPQLLAKTSAAAIPKAIIASIRKSSRSSPDQDPLATDTKDPKENKTITLKPRDAKVNASLILKASSSKGDASPSIKTNTNLPTKPAPKESEATSAKTEDTKTTIPLKVTRSSSTSKKDITSTSTTKSDTPTPKSSNTSSTPSSQSRMLRVVLPSRKSGIMTIPIRSPHPNLKISSVISGGSAVAAATTEVRSTRQKIILDESNGPDIERLQKELADLRRTVARLTKKK